MTPDGTFRILAIRSTQMCREACEAAGVGSDLANLYCRLLTGSALFQIAQAPIDRVQVALHHDGAAGQLMADVWPGPAVRGRVQHAAPDSGPLLGPDVLMEVSRSPARGGEVYRSGVPMVDAQVANAFQSYALESEQVLTLFALACVQTDDGYLARAGGLLVQALPGATREHLEAITGCLEQASFDALVEAGDDPIDAAVAIFSRLSVHHLGDDPVVYRCRCSRAAAISAVSTLSSEELAELRHTGGYETVVCDFCGTQYRVSAADLDGR